MREHNEVNGEEPKKVAEKISGESTRTLGEGIGTRMCGGIVGSDRTEHRKAKVIHGGNQ